VTIVTGAIFIVCVLAFRRGIVGELGVRFKRPGRIEDATLKTAFHGISGPAASSATSMASKRV
jgi:hypothetical protein